MGEREKRGSRVASVGKIAGRQISRDLILRILPSGEGKEVKPGWDWLKRYSSLDGFARRKDGKWSCETGTEVHVKNIVGNTSVYCSSETPRRQNAKNRRKFDLFIPRPSTGRATWERRDAHGARLSEVGKGKKTEREKEEERSFKKNSSSRLHKTATQRSVARHSQK